MVFILLAGIVFEAAGSEGSSGISMQVIDAGEILAKINAGQPVEYDHVIVKGDLDLSREHMRGNITAPIRMNDSIFDGKVSFNYSALESPVDFSGSNFTRDIYFEGTTLRDYATFDRTTFNEPADFVWAIFRKDTDFNLATFKGYADFGGTTFSESAYFNSAIFSGNSVFEEAEFYGNIEFENAVFDKETNFNKIYFNRPAYFENCSIKSLNLAKAEYNHLYLHWFDIVNLQYDETAYRALMKNYNDLGWYGDELNCYYDYRIAARSYFESNTYIIHKSFEDRILDPILWFIEYMEWLLYGYGLRPSFPIFWSAVIVLAFGLFFWHNQCLRKIIIDEKIEEPKDGSDEVLVKNIARKAQISFLDPFLFSLFTFTSGFTAFLHPAVEYKLERCLRWAIFERLLGPFFLALVITTISKTYLIR